MWLSCWLIGCGTMLMGCKTPKDPNEKLATLMQVYLESNEVTALPSRTAQVYRAAPVDIEIETMPLLTEENVVDAKVIDQMGTYALMIEFDNRGKWLLEYQSSSFQGRRLVIAAQFGEKQEQERWLGAPALNRKVANGRIIFTPDATLEECYQIVAGLNNLARKAPARLDW